MKILWIANMLMPKAAKYLKYSTSVSGSWMIDISNMLAHRDDVKLAIACVCGKEFKKIEIDNVVYYLLPGTGKNLLFYTKKYEKIWKKINEDFQPDIVHLHGTEYSHGLSFLRSCPNVKAVVSLQGLLNRIKDVDLGEIPRKEFIKNKTLKQWIKFNGEIEKHCLFKKNAKYETEILKRVNYINAVNTWDSSLAKSINPDLKVFMIEYNLREEMYSSRKWDIEKVDRYSIFTNPGNVPLKGLHQLIKAIALLKNKYPSIKLKVPGMGKDGKLVVTGAYSKYVGKLIKNYGLENNIVFLGAQTSSQMCENFLNSHLTVIPSAIEGSSLVLREAMFLGCPCIASFRGGMADFISDKQDGFLYDYQEYPYLATRIDQVFSNDELAKTFSENAIKKGEKAHSREKNMQDYLNMYEVILRA